MALNSWFPIPRSSQFSLANLPFGIISTASRSQPRPAVAIGTHVLDLQSFAAQDGFATISIELSVFSKPTLNAFAALGRPVHRRVRKYLQDVFSQDTPYPEILKNNAGLQKSCIIRQTDVTMHMPMEIGDYTDFFAGKNHAQNVGALFRGPANALGPNYTHVPIAYHGRASSVVLSGTPITRPQGQILENPAADPKIPIFSPCQKLDFEFELAVFLCKSSKMGEPIPISETADCLFGVVLMNDWSARDIQLWESIPLGPFLSKNFGTSISPWIVLMDALEPFAIEGIVNETKLLPYLQEQKKKNVFDIRLEVDIEPESGSRETIVKSNGRYLLYSFAQMLAHHSVGGCPMRVGDLLGSGTISGEVKGSEGALIELTRGGKEPCTLSNGQKRTFLEDGDILTLRGVCGTEETGLVGFGECKGKILPSPCH